MILQTLALAWLALAAPHHHHHSVNPTPTITPCPIGGCPTPTPYGTKVWISGDPTLGKKKTQSGYGQCGVDVQDGASDYFDLVKDGTNCYRNQILTLNSGGGTFYLTLGKVYTWDFWYTDGDFNDTPPGMGDDLGEAEAIVWQHHGTSEPHTPCSQLGWGNTPIGSPSGQPQQWLVTDCLHTLSNPIATWPYTPGEQDHIVIRQLVATDSSGWTKVWFNGTLVASSTGANFRSGTGNAFWNYGPYKWRWELPSGGGSEMDHVQAAVYGMILYEAP